MNKTEMAQKLAKKTGLTQAKAAETHEEPIGPLPAWARHLTQGYGASQARRGTNASGPVGGGNLYLNRMRDKIKAAITGMGVPTPRHPGEYSIILTRRGQVVDVKLVKSSGLKAFDDAGYAAIIRAGPYGPLPPGVVGDYVEVTFTFTPE